MKISVKNAAKSLLHAIFYAGQACGIDVLPRHFYSEVPDIRRLRKTQAWRQPFTMFDVNGVDIVAQCDDLRALCSPAVKAELADRDIYSDACGLNGTPGFGQIEAECLYAFIRTRRPREIFQIGCGVSTAVCLLAAKAAGYQPAITCIEPYPNDFLSAKANNEEVFLIERPAQELELKLVETLGPDTLFFVDSSHTLGPAGEVTRIILEMLPRLKPGTWAHFHDIRFPYDYDRNLLAEALFFQHESPLLHAFLCCNNRFRIAFSMSMLHYGARDVVKQCFPKYIAASDLDGLESTSGHFPSSLYIRALE